MFPRLNVVKRAAANSVRVGTWGIGRGWKGIDIVTASSSSSSSPHHTSEGRDPSEWAEKLKVGSHGWSKTLHLLMGQVRIKGAIFIFHSSVVIDWIGISCLVPIKIEVQGSIEHRYINIDQNKKKISAITQDLARSLKVRAAESVPKEQRAGIWFRARSKKSSHVSRSGSSLVVIPSHVEKVSQTKLNTEPRASAHNDPPIWRQRASGWLDPPSRTHGVLPWIILKALLVPDTVRRRKP